VTTAVATARDTAARRSWRIDAALLALGAVLLRLPAFFGSRHLTFDDGQYGSAVLGMRDGAAPFRDLFSSQGPLHYPVLYVFDLLGLRTLDGPRLETVVAGAVAAVAAYAIARRITTRSGALVAGALVATSGSILYVTGPLSGDGPALALALTAVALALAYRAQPTLLRAAGVGLAMGGALCIKPLVVPAALAVGGIFLLGRRWRDGAVAAGTAVVLFLVSAAPWGISRVWNQSIVYHRDSHRIRSFGGNVRVLVTTLLERDPFVVAALLLAGVLWWWSRSHVPVGDASATSPDATRDRRQVAWLIAVWLAAQTLFLIVEPAMWRPHVSQVVAPLALFAVLRPPPWRVFVVVAVLLVPWWAVNTHEILWPPSYDGAEQALVDRLRALPDGAWVISDDPGFAWRADRRVPGNFVDVSEKRVQQGQVNATNITSAAARRQVCAVVVWAAPRFGRLHSLGKRLQSVGYTVAHHFKGIRVLYEKRDCKA